MPNFRWHGRSAQGQEVEAEMSGPSARCERDEAGGVDCALAERDLGLFTIREQRLAGVTSVEVESRSGNERLSSGRSRWKASSRIVLADGAGATIRPSVWDEETERVREGQTMSGGEQWVGASSDAMRDTVARFLAAPAEPRVSVWQGQSAPLWIAGMLAALGLLLLGLAALSLFAGPTALIYAAAGRLAAAADARRPQRS